MLELLFSTLIYVVLAIVSFMYYSEGQLNRTIWPTLTMLKIIKVPFIQRFEYIIIFVWFFNYFTKPLLNHLVIMSNDEAFLSYFI